MNIKTSKPCEAIQRKLVDIEFFEILHKFRLLNVLYFKNVCKLLNNKNRINVLYYFYSNCLSSNKDQFLIPSRHCWIRVTPLLLAANMFWIKAYHNLNHQFSWGVYWLSLTPHWFVMRHSANVPRSAVLTCFNAPLPWGTPCKIKVNKLLLMAVKAF